MENIDQDELADLAMQNELLEEFEDDFNEIKRIIAENLYIGDLPLEYPSNKWMIIDYVPENNLYLLHYNDALTESDSRYLSLRGVVYDFENHTIICNSYPGDISINTVSGRNAKPLSTDEYGNLHIQQKNKAASDVVIEAGKYKVFPYIEGVSIRIFKHGGRVFVSTYRKIDLLGQQIHKSRFGQVVFKDLFEELARQARGFSPDKLFDPRFAYSPYVYLFIMQDPKLVTLSRRANVPRMLVYLGYVLNSFSTLPGILSFEVEPYNGNIFTNTNLIQSQRQHSIYQTVGSSNSEANILLNTGYGNSHAKDLRLNNGEALMVYEMEAEKVTNLYKVMGVSASWRNRLHPHKFTLQSALYDTLYRYGYSNPLNTTDLRKKFVFMFVLPDVDYGKNFSRVISSIVKNRGYYGPVLRELPSNISLDMKYKIILLNYILGTSPVRTQEILSYYEKFNKALNNIPMLIAQLNEKKELTMAEERVRNAAMEAEGDIHALIGRVGMGTITKIME